MTRAGFSLLAMGFTGTKALQWKRSKKTAGVEGRHSPIPAESLRTKGINGPLK
jgi:hypothetical protein